MSKSTKARFSFICEGLAKDAFFVVEFSGEEGLSELYSYDILLISKDKAVDLDSPIYRGAALVIKGARDNDPEARVSGMVTAFSQEGEFGPYAFYRATLRPKLWWLTMSTHNQVFLDKKLPDFLEAVLNDGGLSSADFSMNLTADYKARPLTIQYNETHYAFAARWLEHHGCYYWFKREGDAEKLSLSDSKASHAPLPEGSSLRYAQVTGLDREALEENIHFLSVTHRPLPKEVRLADYNYEKPSLKLEAKAPVKEGGLGHIYLYGQNFQDIGAGEALAKLRAEELICRAATVSGRSNIGRLRPGFTFTLKGHYRDEFNREYLLTGLRHQGSQSRYLVEGLGLGLPGESKLFYANEFSAIPTDVQFRPAISHPRPSITGLIPAKIDAAGSGQYAELDDQGRYKVVFSFDVSGRDQGKASSWLRLMQPFAGENMGFHAPLHKGTEVLLGFVDGDPDRPVIVGAVPNPETKSPVTDAEQSKIKLDSGGGNSFHIEDKAGQEHLSLESKIGQSSIQIGTLPPDVAALLASRGLG